MAKLLPPKDFRSRRRILEPADFALYTPGTKPNRKLLIKEKTWHSIVGLPDDVAIQTSNWFGPELKAVHSWWGKYLKVVLTLQADLGDSAPIAYVASSVASDFQSAEYNALVGYYRTGASSLRNVIEQVTFGLACQLEGDTSGFNSWLSGTDLKFGNTCNRVRKLSSVMALENYLTAMCGDDLFRQKNASSGDPGGAIVRLYGALCDYTHANPGHAEVDLWRSNGPVFVPEAFGAVTRLHALAVAYALVGCKLAHSPLSKLDGGGKVRGLFTEVVAGLDSTSDGFSVFNTIPASFWK